MNGPRSSQQKLAVETKCRIVGLWESKRKRCEPEANTNQRTINQTAVDDEVKWRVNTSISCNRGQSMGHHSLTNETGPDPGYESPRAVAR